MCRWDVLSRSTTGTRTAIHDLQGVPRLLCRLLFWLRSGNCESYSKKKCSSAPMLYLETECDDECILCLSPLFNFLSTILILPALWVLGLNGGDWNLACIRTPAQNQAALEASQGASRVWMGYYDNAPDTATSYRDFRCYENNFGVIIYAVFRSRVALYM